MVDIIKNQQHRMSLFCIKCSKFTNNSNIKIKRKMNGLIITDEIIMN